MDRDLMNPPDLPMIEQFELGFKQYAHQMAIAEDVFRHLEFSATHDHLYDTIILGIRARVLSDDLPPERLTQRRYFSYSVPASTWQMWKHLRRENPRWQWLISRHPVRYVRDGRGEQVEVSFDLERFRLYPHAKVRPSDGRFGKVVFAHEVTNLNWRRDDDPR
jgi:hypothetical protein